MKVIAKITKDQYQDLLSRPPAADPELEKKAGDIILRVEREGDAALKDLSAALDGVRPDRFEIPREALLAAGDKVDPRLREAIAQAIQNIEAFHRAQLPATVEVETMPGLRCSLRYLPIERVGLYIPGGTAPLFSTVLMTAIPARLAGCPEVIACTPPGAPHEILYTCSLFNIRVFQLGGAQAIAAMGLGTESVPRVDKLFGPGNAWVTAAKMQLAGRGIAIDLPAGPSEVMVVADHTARPDFVAADLLSQAEHGADSQVVLLATTGEFIQKVLVSLEKQLDKLPRKEAAARALQGSLAMVVDGPDQAVEIANFYAPEHLILSVERPRELAGRIRHAGSVFLGHYCPESAGDYASGTNHTLPTGGFARAWSGITTLSFMKSITFQEMDLRALQGLAPAVTSMAEAEQLHAHARAVSVRTFQNDTPSSDDPKNLPK